MKVPTRASLLCLPVGMEQTHSGWAVVLGCQRAHGVCGYGPEMTVLRANGELQRVATLCRGGSAVVPRKD